jgi:four helix bundle protein
VRFRFEELEIWQRARNLSSEVYALTVSFPRHEQFGLGSQMNRAANAVSLLIAEGAGLQTAALFQHRLGLATGEAFEVAAGSFLARDDGYITQAQHEALYESCNALARKLNAFRQTL